MKSSIQESIIDHSAFELFNIVLDIEKYPEFIPWCNSATIHSKNKNKIIADLNVKYKFFKKTFTSDVSYDSKVLRIDVMYISGPLKQLQTKWKFKKLNKNQTKVLFEIKYEFNNFFYQKMSELFFDLIEQKMIDSFKERADKILN